MLITSGERCYIVYLFWVYVSTHILQSAWGQRTVCGSQFSLSTTQVLGIKLKLLVVAASAFIHWVILPAVSVILSLCTFKFSFHTSAMVWYLSFICLPRIMFVRFIHLAACVQYFTPFMASWDLTHSLYSYITCLSIYLLMHIWIIFIFGLLWVTLLLTFVSFCLDTSHFSWVYLGVKMLFDFHAKMFQKWLHSFTFSPVYQASSFSTSSSTLAVIWHFGPSHPSACKVAFSIASICIFLFF